MRRSRKPLYVLLAYREFESLPLRFLTGPARGPSHSTRCTPFGAPAGACGRGVTAQRRAAGSELPLAGPMRCGRRTSRRGSAPRRDRCQGGPQTLALHKGCLQNGRYPTGNADRSRQTSEQAVIADTLRRPRVDDGGSRACRRGHPQRRVRRRRRAALAHRRRRAASPSGRPSSACWCWSSPRASASTRRSASRVPTQLAFVPLLFARRSRSFPSPWSSRCRSPACRTSSAARCGRAGWCRPSPTRGSRSARSRCSRLAGSSPAAASPALLVAALAAAVRVDFSLLGRCAIAIGRGATLAELLSEPLDLRGRRRALRRRAARRGADPPHVRSPRSRRCPLLGLVAMFARERRQRLESLLELNAAYRQSRATRRSRPRT